MSSYTLLHLIFALDPLTAPWPVALVILCAAILLGRHLWQMLWRG